MTTKTTLTAMDIGRLQHALRREIALIFGDGSVPPPYPYTPEDFSRPGAPVTLHVQVTGRTLSELKAQARLHGKGFFGTGDGLEVALSGTVSQDHSTGETLYTCAAIVRLREGQGGPRHPVQGSDTLPG